MKTTLRTRIRVGIFVVTGLLFGTVVAFALGAQQNLFEPKTTYFAIFKHINGLHVGNTVRVAGVNVGSISKVSISKHNKVVVYFRIINDAAHLIRGNPNALPGDYSGSMADIESKGLLGDQMIEISIGAQDFPVWDPKKPLPTSSNHNLIQLAENTLKEVEGTAHNLQSATAPFADQVFSNDLKATAHNLAKASEMLANSHGTLQALMTDTQLRKNVEEATDNLKKAAGEVTELGGNLNQITETILNGEGTLHTLLYDADGADALRNIREATEQINDMLSAVRSGDGTIHQLIYGDSKTNAGMLKSLNQASADIAYLTSQMRQGKGTIGALLVDPSVYDDIRRLIGNMERNSILRALVRYSIESDEPPKSIVAPKKHSPKVRVIETEEAEFTTVQ